MQKIVGRKNSVKNETTWTWKHYFEMETGISVQEVAKRSRKKSLSKLTPRKKVDVQLRKQGISPSKVKQIRKQLIYWEVLIEEIRLAFEERKNKRKGLRNIVSRKILKKYKLLKFTAMKLKTDRRQLSRTTLKLSLVPRKERKENQEIIHSVQEVFYHDDVSLALLGKWDVKKVDENL